MHKARPHEWRGRKRGVKQWLLLGRKGGEKGGVGLSTVGSWKEREFLSTQPKGKRDRDLHRPRKGIKVCAFKEEVCLLSETHLTQLTHLY